MVAREESGCPLPSRLSFDDGPWSLPAAGSSRSRRSPADLGIAESCLRRWMALFDIEDGRRNGLTGDERRELVELRRRNRVLEMELEIVKRASAYFARENVLPK